MSTAEPCLKPPVIAPVRGAIRVLIVDDSSVVRRLLARELSKDAMIEVVGTAPDAYAARDLIVELAPDVLTLDVEMPKMDGITFLRKLMAYRPIPTIVVSSLTAQGTGVAIDAMTAGAVDVVCKPGSSFSVDDLAPILIEKIKTAARSRVHRVVSTAPAPTRVKTAFTPRVLPPIGAQRVIAIGASTGGVQALTEVLGAMAADSPGIVVVQHMPPRFTASFAERLNQICAIEVREAVDGDAVLPGLALIAPGGFHTTLRRSGSGYAVDVRDGPPVHHQRPSVELLFNSVAESAASMAIGALLTGMGDDGATGLLAMRRAGARTLAQDEQSCVVFGMPMEAIRCGAAECVVSISDVARTLTAMAQKC